MKIGELARLADVAIDTVRFYERRGVLPPPVRQPSGYREYRTATVERLRFVRALQEMGFTLDEIIELVTQVDRGAATCAGERRRFEAVLARVDRKLADLRVVRGRLRDTLERCSSGACALLEGKATGSRGRRRRHA
jgi:DNA-binding transcriptional MerR regulator